MYYVPYLIQTNVTYTQKPASVFTLQEALADVADDHCSMNQCFEYTSYDVPKSRWSLQHEPMSRIHVIWRSQVPMIIAAWTNVSNKRHMTFPCRDDHCSMNQCLEYTSYDVPKSRWSLQHQLMSRIHVIWRSQVAMIIAAWTNASNTRHMTFPSRDDHCSINQCLKYTSYDVPKSRWSLQHEPMPRIHVTWRSQVAMIIAAWTKVSNTRHMTFPSRDDHCSMNICLEYTSYDVPKSRWSLQHQPMSRIHVIWRSHVAMIIAASTNVPNTRHMTFPSRDDHCSINQCPEYTSYDVPKSRWSLQHRPMSRIHVIWRSQVGLLRLCFSVFSYTKKCSFFVWSSCTIWLILHVTRSFRE